MRKILFVCKNNEMYGASYKDDFDDKFITYANGSSGLFNSTKFVADTIGAKVISVVDNNSIDREVASFKPDVVVIEALWVVPEKFIVLKKLHPKVKWFVHLHSNIPFLANEGIAVDWLKKYVGLNVGVIVNCQNAYGGLLGLLGKNHLTWLPNVYPVKSGRVSKKADGFIDIGCFGAIRPMKNHLTQALAAILFAKERNLKLRLHINSSRIETSGGSVLKNIRDLFKDKKLGSLVEHGWLEHADFIKVLKTIDMGMQVSMSETFNIVTADMVSVGLPVVTSAEVNWVDKLNQADPSSVQDIKDKMHTVFDMPEIIALNQHLLKGYSLVATKLWKNWAGL